MEQLWDMFHQPLPPEMLPWWPVQQDKPDEHHPYAIFSSLRESLPGFITSAEAVRLLQQVRIHERPAEPSLSIRGGCIRDGEMRNWNVELAELPPGAAKGLEELPDDDFSYRIGGGKYITHNDLFTY